MAIEEKYMWLTKEEGPLMIRKALELYGTVEKPGKASNPVILKWAEEVGGNVAAFYKADDIPWCGLFMAVVAKRSSKQVVKDPLWAFNWNTFGNSSATPMLGDILIFKRKTSEGQTAGHVGLYVGEDSVCYHVLGGNQGDKVCITRIEKSRLYGARRPDYNIKPQNVRQIFLSNSGQISSNEE